MPNSLIALAGLVVGAGVIMLVLYNRLVRFRNLTREAWSGIDVQLKRRHDLVPNLVDAVRGYAAYEKSLFESVAAVRAACLKSAGLPEKASAENALTDGIRNLMAVAESYPDLKAGRNFLDLQKNLASVEDDNQMARRYYNGAAREFNTSVESFPSNLVAGVFRFRQAEFFEIETATERRNPEIKL